MFPLPFGDARYAPIAAEDQGRVIAAILNDPAAHAGKIYHLYGPKELTQYAVADILTQVRGRKITYAAVEIEAFNQQGSPQLTFKDRSSIWITVKRRRRKPRTCRSALSR